MGELRQLLALWRRAQARGEDVCVATVIHVEGSSYRKPGARMLVTQGGERSGTVSGGCLEAEVARKIWWLTRQGAAVHKYQSSFDEDGSGVAWGLGCGGTVWLLMERNPQAVLEALAAAAQGAASAVLARFEPAGTVCVHPALASDQTATTTAEDCPVPPPVQQATASCLSQRCSLALDAEGRETAGVPAFFAEYLAPPPRLTVFGAGDDAQPIVRFADALGWRVVVADGRSNLLRLERFPETPEFRLLRYPGHRHRFGQAVDTGVAAGELAVVLTHSFEQDMALLHALLPAPLLYLGVLGPRHRTARLIEEAAPALGKTTEECWGRLHAPVGLDLGARDPAAIALAIVAEMQAVVAGRRVEIHRGTEQEAALPGSAQSDPVRLPTLHG